MRRAGRIVGALALSVGMLTVSRAEAFCGFYVSGSGSPLVNKATRVALMRYGTRTVLSMSNDYSGPPENFAMVVPVPVVLQQENVKTLPLDVFTHIETLTAPRLVEYWERDPCYREAPMGPRTRSSPPMPTSASASVAIPEHSGVRIEARFTVGEYNILVLSATESTGLETWLTQNQYNVPSGAATALAPYVRDQWKFFVAKIDITKVTRKPDGSAVLSPLRFHYDSADFRLPVRLGLLNAPEKQDLLVYILHPTSRFETANYPNVFVPTNLAVTNGVRNQFGEFYTALFDATLAHAGGRAVVTEYAWSVGGCDPCPGPPMSDSETTVLGGDVIYLNNPPPTTYHGRAFDYVVTRLHTRYSASTLNEDLVFREAPAVTGGREEFNGNDELDRGAIPETGGTNAFQARYAIRHWWPGRITCAHPHRGVWQEYSPSGESEGQTTAARNLSDVRRGSVALASVVRSPVPSLGLTGTPAVTTTPSRPSGSHKPGALSVVGIGGLTGALGLLVRRLRRLRRR